MHPKGWTENRAFGGAFFSAVASVFVEANEGF
jgi:hypothetical protein